MACKDCRRMLNPKHRVEETDLGDGRINPKYETQYWRSIKDLRDNASLCRICAALLDKLPAEAFSEENLKPLSALQRAQLRIGNTSTGAASYRTALLRNKKDESGRTARLAVRLEAVGKKIVNKSLMPTGQQQVVLNFLLIPEYLALPLSSPASSSPTNESVAPKFARARDWLDRCLSDHDGCTGSRSQVISTVSWTAFRPTRTIQILEGGIKLRPSTPDEPASPYATLSHRWPTDASTLLQLTTDNMDQLQHRIDESGPRFSKVFRDAVAVCRNLHIEHLWIDSLCIIQSGDDGQDWLHEASRMGDVYKHALINIAATVVADGAESMQSGFLQPTNDTFVAPITWKHDFDCINRIKTQTSYQLVSSNDFEEQVGSAVINSRGWVMQERHLSSRILHFAGSQVWWECNESICSEAYSRQHPAFAHMRPSRSKDFLTMLAKSPRSLDGFKAGSALWYRLVQVYSRGSLTFGRDKLVAFSGIAREFQSHFQLPSGEYIAGCWRAHFPYCLLWSISHDDKSTSPARPANWCQAPSWSWASVDREITVHTSAPEHAEPLITIQDIHIEALRKDPFGDIKPGGYLTLHGTLHKARLCYTHIYNNTYAELRTGFLTELGFGSIIGKSYTGKSRGSFAVLPDEPYIGGTTPGETVVYMLPVLKSRFVNWEFGQDQNEWVVMLMLEETEREDVLRRCGLVRLKGPGSHGALRRSWAARRFGDGAMREGVFTIV